MEFWGIEVKPGESLKVRPDEGRLIHISQISLGEVKDVKSAKSVLVRLKIDDKDMVIGTLAAEDRPQILCDLVFEKEFELSHGSKNASVYFLGYEAEDPVDDEEGFGEMSDSEEEEEMMALPQAIKAEPKKTEAAKKQETPKVETPTADEDDSDSDDSEEGDEDEDDSSMDGSDSDESEEEAAPVAPPPSKKRPAESPKSNNAAAGKKAKPNQKGPSPVAAKGNGKPQQGNKFNKGQKGKAGGRK